MPKVTKNEANAAQCPCPACPSYNECAKGNQESLYCAAEVGKSACAFPVNGCVCGQCPVHKANGLKAGYYCLHGSADEVDDRAAA